MDGRQQHKKCFELLKEIYSNPSRTVLQDEYNKICGWLNLEQISWDFETLEQRFHEHVRQSGKSLSDYDFLSTTDGDRTSSEPWLGVHSYLDGLRSCHNVGSIVRTVEAFRLGPIHLSSDMMSPHHPQIVKTSMGAWPSVEITHGDDMQHMPRPWVAIETVPRSPDWNTWIYPSTCTIIVGNEERGIRRSLLEQCDTVVTIPLRGQKNSLNVANAFAIVASEIASQRATEERA